MAMALVRKYLPHAVPVVDREANREQIATVLVIPFSADFKRSRGHAPPSERGHEARKVTLFGR